MKKPIQQKKAQVHVMLENPVEVRKLILNCALDTTHLMKEVHEITSLKERKLKTIKRLERVMREIKALEKQLSGVNLPSTNEISSLQMPHETKHEVVKHFAEKQKEEVHTAPKKVVSKAPKTEADKLKDELKEIEEKLKSL